MRHCIGLAIMALLLFACSTAEKREKERAVRQVRSIALPTLKVRRPAGPAADPEAGPGGVDYASHPLPDARFDCRAPEELYRGLELAAIRECLAKPSADVEVTYELQRTSEPALVLKEKKENPPCIAKWLASIPVPREIFFQGLDVNDAFECYAAGIRSDADRWIGAKLLAPTLAVTIALPLSAPPRDDGDVIRLLLSWSLAPFKSPENDLIPARVVPEALCRACIGDEKYLKLPVFTRIPVWP